MARKVHWTLASRKFVAYIGVVSSLCAGLVVLQHYCMDHRAGDFITGYCLTDTHMRTVLAAVLTILGLVLTAAVTSAVEAFRTARLAFGINEGVYIAIASQNAQYQIRAIFTRWWAVMLVILLAINAPQSLQTLANLGIHTVGVYVRNRSTAVVYDAVSYYNTTLTETDPADLGTAFSLLNRMRDFRTSATSRLVEGGHGVETSVIRDGYLDVTHIMDGDTTNALKRLETVATISTSCTSGPFSGPLSQVVPSDPASVNWTWVDGTANFAVASVYTLLYETMPDGSVLFNSTLSVPLCSPDPGSSVKCSPFDPDTPVVGRATTCSSTLTVQDQIIIYTISADSVTPVEIVSNVTTVNTPDLADLMVNFADGPETTPEAQTSLAYIGSLSAYYGNFPTGSFNVSQSNILHTKLCAAASLAMSFLWTNYNVSLTAVSMGEDGYIGNAYITNDAPVPLYSIVQLTRISTANAATIAGVIVACACLVSVLGMCYAISSRVNIKPATDTSLAYNADDDFIAKKRALIRFLSNDPIKQREFEFKPENVLYCRDLSLSLPDPNHPSTTSTYHRVDVGYAPGGKLPTPTQDYC